MNQPTTKHIDRAIQAVLEWREEQACELRDQRAELLYMQVEASQRMVEAQGFYYPHELPHQERIAELTAQIAELEAETPSAIRLEPMTKVISFMEAVK